MALSEQLIGAMAEDEATGPMDSTGFIVKVLRLRHDTYPGRSTSGTLPVVVLGHESMSESAWRRWVREHAIPNYGAALTERMLRDGIDLKEMLPTAGIGRQLREAGSYQFSYLRRAGDFLTAVEKWPSLYNTVVEQMSETEMTLRKFIDSISMLPSPMELGAGAQTTLGDILPPSGGMVLPGER